MRRTIILGIIMLATQVLFAQQPGSVTDDVKKVVETLFQGMRKGVIAMVSSTFSKGIVM